MLLRAYAYLIFTALCWGGNAVAGKLAVGHVSPLLLTSLRWFFAFLLLTAFGWRTVLRDWPVLRRHLGLLATYGAFGFTLFNAALYTALSYTSAINVVIEQAGMPLMIFLANLLLFRIPITGAQVAGFVLTIAGVVLTASNGAPATLLDLHLNRGDALMLAAIVFYGGYTVALRWKPPVHWLSLMTIIAAFAFLASLPFALWEIARGTVIYPDAEGWLLTAFIAVFPSLISQILYIRGNEMIGGNRASLFINLVPIFGTLLSIMILGETLHPFHVAALALVLGGIALAERKGGAPSRKEAEVQ